MGNYKIKKVLEADYKPTDGEPFSAGWGPEGWTIWCRTPVLPGRPKGAIKKKAKGNLKGR